MASKKDTAEHPDIAQINAIHAHAVAARDRWLAAKAAHESAEADYRAWHDRYADLASSFNPAELGNHDALPDPDGKKGA